MLTPMSDDTALTSYLWPIIREIIKTAIENQQNLIIEGCYIPFNWAEDFGENYIRYIKYRCLVMSESYIRRNYHDIQTNACTVEARCDDSDCTMESLIHDNAKILKMCRQYGVDYFLIDGTYPIDSLIQMF